MIKKFFLALLAVFCLASGAYACTTIMVGRDVSVDGSHFIGRTVDAPSLCVAKLLHIPASVSPNSVTYLDKSVDLMVKLPRKSYECFAIPTSVTILEGNTSAKALHDFWWESVINDKRVGFSATETITSNAEVCRLDPFVKSGLREASIPRLVIPYVNSAREGVEWLGKLIEKHGIVAAEAVVFIDDNEIWYMEIYTGHHYAAQRMPEDSCACIANDAMLGFYDKNDKENWIASPDIIEFAKKAGSYVELDGKFHLALSYGTKLSDDSQLRVWAGRRYFAPVSAGEYDPDKHYDIFFKPEKQISLLDAFELTRDRHENTPQATDKTGNNTRPIGIDRVAQSHFIQFRKKEFAPVQWACFAAPEFSVYFPVLGIPDKISPYFTYYRHKYDPNSFMWKLLEIANLASTDRKTYSRLVREKFSDLEKKFVDLLDPMEYVLQAEGANAVLSYVEQEAETVVNEVKASILELFTRKRIESTKFLGNDLMKINFR